MRTGIVLVAVLAATLAACGNTSDETTEASETTMASAAATTATTASDTPSTTEPSTTTSAPPSYCDEVLAAVDSMDAASQEEIASLAVAFVGPDPDNPEGLRIVGLPLASETGDPHDKRWSPVNGLTTVDAFFEAPDSDRFPARVTNDGSGFVCTENAPPAAGPSGAVDVSRVVELFTDFNGACRGGDPDDPRTAVACDVRSGIGADLDARSWCQGPTDQPLAMQTWGPCSPDQPAPPTQPCEPGSDGALDIVTSGIACDDALAIIDAAEVPSSGTGTFLVPGYSCYAEAATRWCGSYPEPNVGMRWVRPQNEKPAGGGESSAVQRIRAATPAEPEPYHQFSWQSDDPSTFTHDPDHIAFTSPSGNIVCHFGPQGLLCAIWEWEFPDPPPPDERCNYVPLDPGEIVIRDGVVTRGVCTAGVNRPLGAPVLPYGSSVSFGEYACVSETAAVVCADMGNGVGFALSREAMEIVP